MVNSARLVLASRSPRRIEILRREGVAFESIEASVDDPSRPPQGDPAGVSAELARRKAEDVARGHSDRVRDAFVVGADTICAIDGRSIGKPESVEEARAMLRLMAGRAHDVVTSVAVWRAGHARVATDTATVTLPELDDAVVQRYLDGGAWKGKAGAYDIDERRRGGWDIDCVGDPDTVSGLPWRLVRQVMEAWPW